ncbi:hypothetical protein RR46_15048 [Papilio xuthus]|uniref:Uncharacterized protein n=1 Tax=Papilio xuthus TaxID=66420 RepID=A0A194PFR7_PAPXU|nr:hypothetical protein RR46_15048 [Papilio xuthus]
MSMGVVDNLGVPAALIEKKHKCVYVCVAWTMSGTGVASRSAEPVSLPAAADLPVRIYMRALRQYHKLLDLKRFTFKEKVSQSSPLH